MSLQNIHFETAVWEENGPQWFIIPFSGITDKCVVVADCHGFIDSAFEAFEFHSPNFSAVTIISGVHFIFAHYPFAVMSDLLDGMLQAI
ncbi:hypothetical protein T265_04200 [Opisthorchis viverrini]|uniref:Uncharacterized protein n=1 Tax=Opisthorchis viverrini TaxID=6198 RepID=A0A074ZTF0_OPIVI|nr:hypothetical protein T265_04200 [Opisthorchis viverrini]KER29112.1 hypothetical protein T265_04200 [Opisthorchis viverrini]